MASLHGERSPRQQSGASVARRRGIDETVQEASAKRCEMLSAKRCEMLSADSDARLGPFLSMMVTVSWFPGSGSSHGSGHGESAPAYPSPAM